MGEEWRDIPGFDGEYQASNLGRVRSLKHNKIRIFNGYKATNGYLRVQLSYKGKKKGHPVHRLILWAFIGKSDGHICNHKDFDRANNKVENLEWVTQRQNIHHARDHGRTPKGTRNGQSKLTPEIVQEIRRRHKKRIVTYKHLAKEYGVYWGTIRKANRGVNWN